MNVVIVGKEQLMAKLKQLKKETKKDAYNELVAIGYEIRNKIVKSMRDTPKGSGKGSLRTKSGLRHYPSIPDNPPAIDRGDLVGDIKVRAGYNEVEVGDVSQPHGVFMEKGTSKIEPRPWLHPAYSDMPIEKRIGKILEGNIRQ